jgi:hypothetical protein
VVIFKIMTRTGRKMKRKEKEEEENVFAEFAE